MSSPGLKKSEKVEDFTKIAGNLNTGSNSGSTGSGANSTGSGKKSTFSSFTLGGNKANDKPTDPLMLRLYRIRDAYKPPTATSGFGVNKSATPTDSFKFSSVVYNISTGQDSRPPSGISQQNWEKELAKAKQYPTVNTDPMVPSLLQGFKGLNDRISQQEQFVKKMSEKLKSMKIDIQRIRQNYDKNFIDKIQKISENNREISEKLMTVLQKKESFADKEKIAFTPQEHELFDRLQKLENELSKPNKYKSALNALNLKSIMIRESGPFNPEIKITDQTNEAEAIIRSNHEAISSLVNLIAKTQNSTTILEKAYQEKSLENNIDYESIINP